MRCLSLFGRVLLRSQMSCSAVSVVPQLVVSRNLLQLVAAGTGLGIVISDEPADCMGQRAFLLKETLLINQFDIVLY